MKLFLLYIFFFFYFYLNGLLFPQALEKLEHAKENLVKTNEEFENARKRAKKAKASYERIKKERIDKFMTCFEHVSNEIDGIYKVCITRKEKERYLFTTNYYHLFYTTSIVKLILIFCFWFFFYEFKVWWILTNSKIMVMGSFSNSE